MLENKNIQENLELLNELKYLAIENKRFDNLYILIQKFPILSDNSVNINKINENLIEIEELLQPIKDQQLGIEEFMKKQLYQKLKSFNIGFLKLPINNTYLPHLIIKSKNLWAFECLKDIYNDLFFLDDESNTCFHYLKPNIDIGIISFEDLNIIIQCFGHKYKEILNVLEIFTENFKKMNLDYNEEYIKFLFSSLPEEIFTSYNDSYNSLFHILSGIKFTSNINKLIIEKLNNLKQKNKAIFIEILNLQNIMEIHFYLNF